MTTGTLLLVESSLVLAITAVETIAYVFGVIIQRTGVLIAEYRCVYLIYIRNLC